MFQTEKINSFDILIHTNISRYRKFFGPKRGSPRNAYFRTPTKGRFNSSTRTDWIHLQLNLFSTEGKYKQIRIFYHVTIFLWCLFAIYFYAFNVTNLFLNSNWSCFETKNFQI